MHKLDENEWIAVGIGNLLCVPFMGRCLLFRLFDINSALLIYHDNLCVSTAVGHPETGVVNLDSISWPTAVNVHFSPVSPSISLQDLLHIPATVLKLTYKTQAEHTFGPLKLQIEYHLAQMSRRWISSDKRHQLEHIKIATSGYCARGSIRVTNWPEHILAEHLQHRCWKIHLINEVTHRTYGTGSMDHWTLEAFDLDKDGHPIEQMLLESKVGD